MDTDKELPLDVKFAGVRSRDLQIARSEFGCVSTGGVLTDDSVPRPGCDA
jgi:hypothetical protein